MTNDTVIFRVILVSSLLAMAVACVKKPQSIETVEEIDLIGAYLEKTDVPISKIATDIEYIRLETGEDFMLNEPYLTNVKDSFVLFIGFRKIYIFNRYTGRFMYEISNYGRGPDEYSATGSIYGMYDDLFYVSYESNRKDQNNYGIWGAHNFSGKMIKTVSKPNLYDSENNEVPIIRFWPLDDTLYLGYVFNSLMCISEKLVIFDKKGTFVKFYPNYYHVKFRESNIINVSLNDGMFFNVLDTVRFFELYTDTVFSVSSLRIEPRYHITMGDQLIPYQIRTTIEAKEYLNYFHIRTMHESSRFLMFSVGIYGTRHLAFYDKTQKRTMVCDAPADLDFYKFDNFYGIRCIGFSNDLDDFIPIGTDKNFYINKNDEFVTAIPALEVRRWFDMNPEKAKKLPEHLQAFRDINAEDNPVIVVAKLKK